MKHRRQNNNTVIILLAYAHRYLYPLLIIGIPFLIGKETVLLNMGIGFVLFAVYDFIGYRFHWKHIFCSFQNAYREKMTPNRINWSHIKKADVYGVAACFGVIGFAMISCSLFFREL